MKTAYNFSLIFTIDTSQSDDQLYDEVQNTLCVHIRTPSLGPLIAEKLTHDLWVNRLHDVCSQLEHSIPKRKDQKEITAMKAVRKKSRNTY